MPLCDTVFAVIPSQLGKECHGFLRALLDELAEEPRHGLCKDRPLMRHIGREEVAGRAVDGEPTGIEAADQLVGAGPRFDRCMQRRQCVTVVESHAEGY